jgi:hypothetical protein
MASIPGDAFSATGNSRITFELPQRLHHDFKVWCAQRHTTIRSELVAFIETRAAFLHNCIPAPAHHQTAAPTQLFLLPPDSRPRIDGFDEWWSSYPHKVGKGAARKAFEKVRRKGTSLADLIAGVQRYIAMKPPEIAYCHPATWLNQDRWLDEPAPQPERTNGFDRNRPTSYGADIQHSAPPAPTAESYAALARLLGDVPERGSS